MQHSGNITIAVMALADAIEQQFLVRMVERIDFKALLLCTTPLHCSNSMRQIAKV